ncbi:MAG: hypothetical protein KDI48_14440 [Xanthomonadales bacterium]|nr:hypothetical protein [Xanthomonadales bacterium]
MIRCLLATASLSLLPFQSVAALQTPLLDGRCSEYAELGALSQDLDQGVRLWVYQNDDYVWMCLGLPELSFGTLDLALDTPKLDGPRALHVSAQLGEWPLDQPDQAPPDAASPLWWQVRGWTANTLRFNGLEDGENGPTPRFLPSEARELQFAKSRFGVGTWRFRFDLNAVKGGDGLWHTVQFPAAEGEARPWATLETVRPQ